MKRTFLFICLLSLLLSIQILAIEVPSFYGLIEVEEPIILELLESLPMQRLKKIHQYGDAYYTTHREEYNRFDHSVGVFALLRIKGCSLEEQIAGLLHDVSHTVFSHVGDQIFGFDDKKDSYQDSVHEYFLRKYEISKILEKHGYSIDQIIHKSGRFHALENDLPDLCADRIEYNLQGAYYQRFLSKEEIIEIVNDLEWSGGRWTSSKVDLMKKMVRFALHMTHTCWGSARGYMTSMWLGKALVLAVQKGDLSEEDIYFGSDDEVWTTLKESHSLEIRELMEKIMSAEDYFELSKDTPDFCVYRKFRGFDPWIRNGLEVRRLSELDDELHQEYLRIQNLMKKGWSIQLKSLSPTR